jgi:purine-binding chemotaxis protein CheW
LPQPADTVAGILQLITFSVGAQEFAINALEVDQVLVPLPVTRLPHSPEYVSGVITHRGQVLPVIDMRRRLRLPPSEATQETSMIAIRTRGLAASLLVDRVTGFLKVAAHDISFQNLAGSDSFVTGIALPGDSPKTVLDLHRLIDPTGQRQAVRSS